MDITLHFCQGNLRSKKFYDAKYDGLVDTIFQLPFSGFFMEFDDEKYCNFSLLEKRQGQKIVLGLINSQTSWKTRKSCLSARRKPISTLIQSRSALLPNTFLPHQYVFASTEVGNLISEEGQWRKLDLVHELVESLNA
ncbi:MULTISPECIES: 5-methyltetrahydropteroyltriglutamate--homocysteine methyltransferase [Lactobacillus]|uniref:5-methyltetrahydropteroyltriglutamate-- homocysteine methyltransferase n=1 Tax=Lactobacillus TaxID=1578 RepID=UPI0004AC3D2F|nr:MULTISPECIES: 5-methyltetrahydropteroyltriglutamate--homocysteine methyltransferase [Lactobacillus]MCD5451297.1 5-methyltetrahydropteroyltriglutamate--homocysteine methyltransferase [Lactobacillus delbrueckii subsp. lactis]MCD5490155.1 5-methyltetrahydropteroyltriglutamate--homocysteine methyltransferase [Lactobacillus delbrueckii subsp. lactis]MCD5495613.1 5-methyltetrahydropteroyltriglutamate--homocysteine methyltransferase [Lactobacillus delbrueckii subsp. lactis]MCD5499125.1 5-methyltetr